MLRLRISVLWWQVSHAPPRRFVTGIKAHSACNHVISILEFSRQRWDVESASISQ